MRLIHKTSTHEALNTPCGKSPALESFFGSKILVSIKWNEVTCIRCLKKKRKKYKSSKL